MYLVVVLVVAVSLAVMYHVCERTNAGQAFRAIREDEVLAQTLGIDTTRYKLLAFALSSGFAGLAGALYAYYVQLVSPSVASAATTSLIIGMVVFGGKSKSTASRKRHVLVVELVLNRETVAAEILRNSMNSFRTSSLVPLILGGWYMISLITTGPTFG